jgi:hypothetical protein
MRLLAIGVEHAFDAVVHRPQHEHVGEHQPSREQAEARIKSLRRLASGASLGQLLNVAGGIFERDQL